MSSAGGDKPDSFWITVYLSVVVTTILVIGGLALFSSYFR
jgi:hypothetical protein